MLWKLCKTCLFVSLQDLLDPERGYVQDDKVTLEVKVVADAPHGVRYITLISYLQIEA